MSLPPNQGSGKRQHPAPLPPGPESESKHSPPSPSSSNATTRWHHVALEVRAAGPLSVAKLVELVQQAGAEVVGLQFVDAPQSDESGEDEDDQSEDEDSQAE